MNYSYLDDDENVKDMRITAAQIGLNALVVQLMASETMLLSDMRNVMKIAELLGMDVMEELQKVMG